MNTKATSAPAMFLTALLALTSVLHAGYITGSVNFSSAPGGGVILQDSGEILTTNLAAAAGIKSWTMAEVETGSGSFDLVADGTSVAFLEPWIFNPLTSTMPLWTIAGAQGFTFYLTSFSKVHHSKYFLAIRGTGTITAYGFEDTPATWWFTTQGMAADQKFSWSSTTVADKVPDGGTTLILLVGSLFGIHCLRRHLNARL